MDIERDSLTRERDRALFDAYKKARAKLYLEANSFEDYKKIHTRAVGIAINTPQPRFWISQDRTYRILRLLVNKCIDPKDLHTWKTRLGMNEEILNAYKRIHGRRMFDGMSLWFIASFVTYEPSSGFYMSWHRAVRAIKKELKRRKEAE